MSKFEVQHYTLCDGWVNTWLMTDSDGNESIEVFNTYQEANDALDEFLEDTMDSFKAGDLSEPYFRDQFRVVKVKS